MDLDLMDLALMEHDLMDLDLMDLDLMAWYTCHGLVHLSCLVHLSGMVAHVWHGLTRLAWSHPSSQNSRYS